MKGLTLTAERSSGLLFLYHHIAKPQLPEVRRLKTSGDVVSLSAEEAILNRGNDVRCLGPSALPQTPRFIEDQRLLNFVDSVFEVLARRSALLSWIRSLYDSLDIDYFFLRMLLSQLSELLRVAHLVGTPSFSSYDHVALAGRWPYKGTWIAFLKLWKQDGIRRRQSGHLPLDVCRGLDRLSMKGESAIRSINLVMRCLQAAYWVARTWYVMFKAVRFRSSRLTRAHLILRTYATDWGFRIGEEGRLRNIDFVVDGKALRVQDVGIWVEPGVADETRKNLLQKGYKLLSGEEVRFGLFTFLRNTLPMLLFYTAAYARMAREESWWYSAISELLLCNMIWSEVCRQSRPSVFLAYNDLSPLGVARNIVLRRHGCRSVFYQHSAGTGVGTDGTRSISHVYSYLVFDIVVTWGPDHSDFFRLHSGSVGEFWEVGCPWSEHARLVTEKPSLYRKYRRQLASHVPASLADYEKLVGVFDSTVRDLTSARSWAVFYRGIARLAGRLPHVLFLFKPKKPIQRIEASLSEFGEQIESWVPKNLVVLPHNFETAAVVGLSELTIGDCLTSLVIEAIGLGRRAVYYDPTNRYPCAFSRFVPNLVCTADDELYARVCDLLWASDDETYLEYLRTHLARAEGYFDGQAITRLRQRLLRVMDGCGSSLAKETSESARSSFTEVPA